MGTTADQNGEELQFITRDKIGEGSGIEVYEAALRHPPRGSEPWPYALKRVRPVKSEFDSGKKTFEHEVRILRVAQQHHVVKYKRHFVGGDKSLNLVMERADDSLAHYLDQRLATPLNNQSRANTEWFMCLANVVDHIHSMGIRHRDIKPQNILLRGETILLADFGISSVTLGPTMPTTIPNYARGRTREYCAPEVANGSTRGRSGDIFSLGAVFLKMFVTFYYPGSMKTLDEYLLYTNPSSRYDTYCSFAESLDEVPRFIETLESSPGNPPSWNDRFVQLCLWMLEKDRDYRPESKQVLRFLREIDPSDFPATSGGRCICVPDPELTLVEACKVGDRRRANYLLEKELENNHSFLEKKPGPIHQAAANGHKEIVEDMIRKCDHRKDHRKELMRLKCYSDQTALHCAASCEDEHVSLVELLLDNGADAMAVDVEGRTALHYAAGQGHAQIVRALLSRKAGPGLASIPDSHSKHTALHIAAKRGHAGVVKVLLEEFKISPDEKTNKDFSALHFAAGYGSVEVVELLLENGALFDAQDNVGWTPLHWAADGRRPNAETNYAQVFRLLIEKGANVQIRDKIGRPRGWRPQDCARNDFRENSLEEAQRRYGRSEPKSPSIEDLSDEVIRQIEEADVLSRDQSDRHLPEAKIEQISLNLPTHWKGFTRVIIILTIIERLHLFSLFLKHGITDENLPYDHEALKALEIFSSHPSICLEFHVAQRKLFNPIEYFERKIQKSGTLLEDEWKLSLDQQSRIWGTDSDKVQVLRVSYKNDPQKESALKIIRRFKRPDDRRERSIREVTILQRIDHANIVRLNGSFRAPDSVGILISPVASQNLDSYMRKTPVDDEMRKVLTGSFGCLIDAVCYLHHEGYVRHDDLKPQNILVNGDRVLITDFDISLDWKETQQSTTPGSSGWTEKYRSPEVMGSEIVRSSSDIWSLGCVFLEVATVLKEVGIERLQSYLGEKGMVSYCQDQYITRGWIDAHLRRTQVGKVDDEPLLWISHMIRYPPEKRKSAWQLREMVRESGHDKASQLSYHGPCCAGTAGEFHEKNAMRLRRGLSPVKEESETARADQNTSIAVTGWSDEHRIYFQGENEAIFQMTRRPHDHNWLDRDPEAVVLSGDSKKGTPIAATAWQPADTVTERTKWDDYPTVHVFFLNQDDCIRERIWEPLSGWKDGPLGKYDIKTGPSSHLAVMSNCKGRIFLCYQDIEGRICLVYRHHADVWQSGITIKAQDVIPGSSLVILSFKMSTGDNNVRLYYQAKDRAQKIPAFKELVWVGLTDDFQPDALGEPVYGGYSCPSAAGASIAAVAWGYPSLEMRVFAGRSSFVVQHRFGFDEWSQWPLVLVKGVGGRRFAAGRLESSNVCHLYFINQDGRVAEMMDAHFHGRQGSESTAESKIISRFLIKMMESRTE